MLMILSYNKKVDQYDALVRLIFGGAPNNSKRPNSPRMILPQNSRVIQSKGKIETNQRVKRKTEEAGCL